MGSKSIPSNKRRRTNSVGDSSPVIRTQPTRRVKQSILQPESPKPTFKSKKPPKLNLVIHNPRASASTSPDIDTAQSEWSESIFSANESILTADTAPTPPFLSQSAGVVGQDEDADKSTPVVIRGPGQLSPNTSKLSLVPDWQGFPFYEPDSISLRLAFVYSSAGLSVMQYSPSTLQPSPAAAPKSAKEQQVHQSQRILRSAKALPKRDQDLRLSEPEDDTRGGSPAHCEYSFSSKSSAVKTIKFECELFLGESENSAVTQDIVLYLSKEQNSNVIDAGSAYGTVTTIAGVTPQTRFEQVQKAADSQCPFKVTTADFRSGAVNKHVIRNANDLEALRLSMMLDRVKQDFKSRSGNWKDEQVDTIFSSRAKVVIVCATVKIEEKQIERQLHAEWTTRLGISAKKVKFISKAEATATCLGTQHLQERLEDAGTPDNQDKWFKDNADVACTFITTDKSCTGAATITFHKNSRGTKDSIKTHFFPETSEIPHGTNVLARRVKKYLRNDINVFQASEQFRQFGVTFISLLEYLVREITNKLVSGDHDAGDFLVPFPHNGSYFEVGEDCIVHRYRDYFFPGEARRFIVKEWLGKIVGMVEEHLEDFDFLNPSPRQSVGGDTAEDGKWKHAVYLTGPGLQSGRTAYALAKMLAAKGIRLKGLHIWHGIDGTENDCEMYAARGALLLTLRDRKTP
jgi:hypothetical protein